MSQRSLGWEDIHQKGPERKMKYMKVKVPRDVAARLHALKILTGIPINTMIARALARYFEKHGVHEEGADTKEDRR